MFQQLSGATRLYPIIGDPVKYVESPARLTTTFEDRGHNGLCIPMQAGEGDLGVVMAGLTALANVEGILVTMPHKSTTFAYCATVPSGPECSGSSASCGATPMAPGMATCWTGSPSSRRRQIMALT